MVKVNAGNYFPVGVAFAYYNAQMLVFSGGSLISKRRAGAGVGVAFTAVNIVFGNNFIYLPLVNMPAFHTAAGMAGVNKAQGACGRGAGLFRPLASAKK